MLGLYREKQVKKVIERLKAEYEAAFSAQKTAIAQLKEENRVLKARNLELEAERGEVAAALIRAEQEGGRIREEAQRERENGAREGELLAAKCRALSEALLAKYPMETDVREFAQFVRALGEEPQESGFDLEEVLAPKQPLDLGKICRDLGLMEEEG